MRKQTRTLSRAIFFKLCLPIWEFIGLINGQFHIV
jgi:hypothetical protein